MEYDASKLLTMSQAQLDDLFRASPPGDIPNGSADGTAIIAPGTVYSASIAQMINLFDWQGKVFDAAEGIPEEQDPDHSASRRLSRRSTRRRAGWTAKSASCSTTRTPRWSRIGSAMRSASSAPTFIWARFTGTRPADRFLPAVLRPVTPQGHFTVVAPMAAGRERPCDRCSRR